MEYLNSGASPEAEEGAHGGGGDRAPHRHRGADAARRPAEARVHPRARRRAREGQGDCRSTSHFPATATTVLLLLLTRISGKQAPQLPDCFREADSSGRRQLRFPGELLLLLRGRRCWYGSFNCES